MIDRLPLKVGPWAASSLTLLAVLLALWVRYIADAALPSGFPFVSFLPATVLIAVLLGTRYGIAAATAGGLLAWHFFIPPRGGFSLHEGALTAMSFYLFVVGTEIAIIHWMLRANRHLAIERERSAELARTRALLFDELQHRVSNNLQAVAGLLALQRRRLADPQAATALGEAAERVALIGRISRRLYDADAAGKGLAAFLKALLDDVIEANGRGDIVRRIECPEDATVPQQHALPVALVVAEAVANAIEHGLGDRPDPRISVVVTRSADGMDIAVCDNGGTLPAGFAADAGDSMGLSIATTLARQAGGWFAMTGGAETRAVLHLPAA